MCGSLLRGLVDLIKEGLSSPRIVVSLLLIVSYTLVWSAFFSVRVISTIDRNGHSYAKAQFQNLTCQTAGVGEAFSGGCEQANARVSIPLWRESLFATWDNSTLCGGDSCFSQIFGKEETVTSILMRATLLFSCIGIIVFVAWRIALVVERWTKPSKSDKYYTPKSSKKQNKEIFALPNIQEVVEPNDDNAIHVKQKRVD